MGQTHTAEPDAYEVKVYVKKEAVNGQNGCCGAVYCRASIIGLLNATCDFTGTLAV